MTVDRRRFLQAAAALGAAGVLARPVRLRAQPSFGAYPFALGVASGYPHSGGMTLWTRVTPQPHEALARAPIEIGWEIAADEAFRTIVAQGKAPATPAWGHSVHVDVQGLAPARPYWYRFHAGAAATSPVGRTRTAPAPDAPEGRLRFAFAACQQYEHGYFTAYRHMAREDLDLVVHLGDYIYESTWGRNLVRSHGSDQPRTLEEYRARYALYKGEPELQAAHAAFPWIVTWDDHEVQNDYANDRSRDLDPPAVFLARRAAAYQAYYEHMPLPEWARPRGHDMRLYSHAQYGALASFFVLDTRQYRSHQVCTPAGRGGSNVVREEACPERLDPALTMLGAEQERWLHEGIGASRTRWNVVAQQTLMAQADRRPGPGADYWTDGWDGYPAARRRLLASLASQRVSNPLVIGGDVHTAVVADLKLDFDDTRSAVIASELVCPSITSQGPSAKRVELVLQENPHVHFANGTQRGYTTVELTATRCVARVRTLGNVRDRDTEIRTLAAYAVQDGRPGPQRY